MQICILTFRPRVVRTTLTFAGDGKFVELARKGIVIERHLTNVGIVDQYLNLSTQSIAFLAK